MEKILFRAQNGTFNLRVLNLILGNQELLEKVRWSEFLSALVRELNIPSDDVLFESLKKILGMHCLSNIANLSHNFSVTTEESIGVFVDFVTMERFDKVIKIFGLFYDAVEGQRTLGEVLSTPHRIFNS